MMLHIGRDKQNKMEACTAICGNIEGNALLLKNQDSDASDMILKIPVTGFNSIQATMSFKIEDDGKMEKKTIDS